MWGACESGVSILPPPPPSRIGRPNSVAPTGAGPVPWSATCPVPVSSAINRLEDYYSVDLKKDLLGQGAFGMVYAAECKRTGQPRAVKAVSKKKLKTPGKVQVLEQEIDIHFRLDHRNTVRMYEVCGAGLGAPPRPFASHGWFRPNRMHHAGHWHGVQRARCSIMSHVVRSHGALENCGLPHRQEPQERS